MWGVYLLPHPFLDALLNLSLDLGSSSGRTALDAFQAEVGSARSRKDEQETTKNHAPQNQDVLSGRREVT